MFAGTGSPIPPQEAAQVSANWPGGEVGARMGTYLCQAQQKWAISGVPTAGGYLGSPYFKITIAGTERALAATEDAELVVLPAFTGAPEKLWRMDQLADGSWYVHSRSVPLQPYFESDFPHGHDQWISAAATAWSSRALSMMIAR